MRLETEHEIRAGRQFRRLLGVAGVFLLGSAACVADNRLGLDDGDGGAGTDGTDPTGVYPVMAYALTADVTLDQLAVATGATAGRVTILDAHDGTRLRVLEPTTQTWPNMLVAQASGVVAVGAFSAWLFRSDGTLLRDIPSATGNMFRYPSTNWTTALALSADGKFLVTADDGWLIRRIDVATGAEGLSPFAQLTPDESGLVPFIASLAVSPDGATIAAGGWTGVHVWRASDGALLATIPGSPQQVLFSPSGELAVASSPDVTFHSVTGEELGRHTFAGSAVLNLAYSVDGTRLAVVTDSPSGQADGTIVVSIIDRATGTETARLFDPQRGGPGPGVKSALPIGVAFIENDAAVALGWSDRRVTLFGVSDGLPIWSRVLDE